MSDFSDQEFEDESEGPAGLRKYAKDQEAKAREAEAALAAAQRELAFAKAGLPLNDPKMTYFVKGYDGDLNPEAIKAAAEAAGFLAPAEAQVPPEELAQHQAVAQLSAGATGTPTFQGPYYENPQYQQEIRMARTPDEVLAKVRAAGGTVMDDLDW